jgi:hypothetical protein
MFALMLALALIGVTVLALLLAGALAAIATGILALNACLLVVALHRRAVKPQASEPRERWRPSSFRRPPEPPGEREEPERGPQLRVHRL